MATREAILFELVGDLEALARVGKRDGHTPHEVESHREKLIAEADRRLAEIEEPVETAFAV